MSYTGYDERVFRYFSQSLPPKNQFRDITLNYATTASLYVTSSALFAIRHIIRRYKIPVTDAGVK